MQAEMRESAQFRKIALAALNYRVKPDDQHHFPEIFPHAEPPAKKGKDKTAEAEAKGSADSPAAESKSPPPSMHAVSGDAGKESSADLFPENPPDTSEASLKPGYFRPRPDRKVEDL